MSATASPTASAAPAAPAARVDTPARTTRVVGLPNNLSLTIDEAGPTATATGPTADGGTVLLLHGGAGPRTMAGLATTLSEHVRTITPTHPGFDGTPRPEWADSIADLAIAYLDLLDTLDLTGVMVIGNSVGGWIAAEMALRDTRGRIGCLTLLNAVGIHTGTQDEILDVRALAPAEISQLSFANAAFRPDFSTFTDRQRAGMAANQKTLATYGGPFFTHDPKLHGRLHRVTVPVLVVWGEQDGIAPLPYGRAFADAFPTARFAPIPEAAHFPHIEQPGRTLAAIGDFVDTVMKPTA
ncbi:alpha/beta fold hydrolase [Streptomyces sp. NBC_01190]|uniref:alpha/beta fold hydrolase n=1 Tax=Streptomyces sp. NBC_01190 TaxID=2903767 RepID=UPI003869FCB6|nr:alpha/beta hydrolase [Streptomyces sp. NBC_01190]